MGGQGAAAQFFRRPPSERHPVRPGPLPPRRVTSAPALHDPLDIMTSPDIASDPLTPLHHTLDLLLEQIQWQGPQHLGRSAAVCLHALRAGVRAHVHEEARRCRCVPSAEHADVLGRVREQSDAISRRLRELQQALERSDSLSATACATDLKEMLSLHLQYERTHLDPLLPASLLSN